MSGPRTPRTRCACGGQKDRAAVSCRKCFLTSQAFNWNDDLDRELRRFRNAGLSYKECADRFGIDDITIGKRCREFGINQKMNVGRKPALRLGKTA